MTRGLHSFFYFRSRHIDWLWVAILPAMFLISTTMLMVLLWVVAIIGIWLIVGGHRSARFGDRTLWLISSIWALYAFAHMIAGVAVTGQWSMVCIPYPSYFILTVPVAVGLVLVRDPMRAIVWGCRISIIAGALLSIYTLAAGSTERIGFGTNPLIAAYIFMLFACLARYPAKQNENQEIGVAIFYLGGLIAIATGARIVALFYAVVLLFDIARMALKALRGRQLSYFELGLVCIAVSGGIAGFFLFDDQLRSAKTVAVIFDGVDLDRGLSIRVDLWNLGLDLFASNPIFGVGQCALPGLISDYLVDSQGQGRSFNHLHSLLIHEGAAYGILGLVFLVLFYGFLFQRLYVLLNLPAERTSTIIVFLGIAIYGITGTHISDDRMAAITAFLFGTLLAAGYRRSWKKGTVRFPTLAKSRTSKDIIRNTMTKPLSKKNAFYYFISGALIAIAISVLSFAVMLGSGSLNRYADKVHIFVVSQEDVEKAREAVIELRAFTDRFIVALTEEDSLLNPPSTKRFYSIASVWRDEYLELSEDTRRQMTMLFRKDASGYKILFDGHLCAVATSTKLFEKDPKRELEFDTLCRYFSVWNEDGANF